MWVGYGSGVHGARCIVRSFSTEQPRVWGILGVGMEDKGIQGKCAVYCCGISPCMYAFVVPCCCASIPRGLVVLSGERAGHDTLLHMHVGNGPFERKVSTFGGSRG